MEWILFLAAGVAVGLGIGWVAGSMRTARRRRRRDLAVAAELQAARQRAERAGGEVQALRSRLEAAHVLAARVSEPEAELSTSRGATDAPVIAAPAVSRTTAYPAEPPEPAVVAPQVIPEAAPMATSADVARVAEVVAPAGASMPTRSPDAPAGVNGRRPAPAGITPVLAPVPRLPGVGTARAPVSVGTGTAVRPPSPARAPDTTPPTDPRGWRALRPGLSDPHGWLGSASPNGTTYAHDDLQRVHGVGPYLARRLREEGILTWRQIAEWDEDDMVLVARHIGSFPDRIRREDWPASARSLHEATYGERIGPAPGGQLREPGRPG